MQKKILERTVAELPDEFSLDELIERLILIEKIEAGRKDGYEGRTLTNEEAKQRLLKWQK